MENLPNLLVLEEKADIFQYVRNDANIQLPARVLGTIDIKGNRLYPCCHFFIILYLKRTCPEPSAT